MFTSREERTRDSTNFGYDSYKYIIIIVITYFILLLHLTGTTPKITVQDINISTNTSY